MPIPDDPTVVVPPDAVIEYSASTNPCRPEMAAGPDADWQGGDCDADWSTALPGGAAENVRAWRLRVPFVDPAWQPAQRMVLDLHFQAPPDAVPGEITWNSVAHRSTDAQSLSRLPTAEPRKVGIRVPASALGGKAFRDIGDRNSVFDDGTDEVLPDIDVTLFDEDGNEIATTTTDADGNYVFPGLPPGRYRIQFDRSTLPPDDAIVPAGAGDDPALDSDADPLTGSTGFIDLPPNVTDLTYNVGVRERVVALTAAKAAEGEITEETGTYLIEIANEGEDPTGPPVTVVDTLPAGLTFASAAGQGWSCAAEAQVVTCTNAGPFAAAADLPELRLAVDVTADPGATVTNRVAVFSDPDAEAPDDEASVDAVIVALPVPTSTTTTTTTTPAATTTTTRPGGSGGRLPVVGSNLNAAVDGLVLVAAGAAMWLVTRRRRPSPPVE